MIDIPEMVEFLAKRREKDPQQQTEQQDGNHDRGPFELSLYLV